MVNRGQFVFGSLLVLLGVMFLLSTLFQIDFGPFCWSFALIAAGVWLVLRPRMIASGTGTVVQLFADINRRGAWQPRDQEYWLGIGDVKLDLTEAVLPPGETTLRFYTFISDVEILVPRAVGVAARAAGVVVDSKLFGQDREAFFSPVETASENYGAAERRVRISMIGFIASLKLEQHETDILRSGPAM